MPIRGGFLDLDGVINAHGVLGPRCRRHVGYMPTRELAREAVAVAVDDAPAQLDLATRAGANMILMHPELTEGGFDAGITAIEQLPAAVDTVNASLP